MQYLDAIILGLVEGITEFLPISSTAHLLLTQKVLGLDTTTFLSSFTIAIQLGAIGAVVFLYLSRFAFIKKIYLKIFTALIPTAVVGLLVYDRVRDLLEGNTTLLWALGIGGIILIIFELLVKEKEVDVSAEKELQSVSYLKSFSIGLAQALAVIPGVSRAGATIVAGRSLGLSRSAVVEFSFLLAIPTVFMATVYDLYKQAPLIDLSKENIIVFTIGFFTAFVSAYVTVKWLLSFIKSHNFIMFGFYRIVLALLCIPLFL